METVDTARSPFGLSSALKIRKSNSNQTPKTLRTKLQVISQALEIILEASFKTDILSEPHPDSSVVSLRILNMKNL